MISFMVFTASGRPVKIARAIMLWPIFSSFICGMAAQSFDMGETLVDRLERVYAKYGYGFENAVSFTLEGKEGIEKIGASMSSMRSELEASDGKETPVIR